MVQRLLLRYAAMKDVPSMLREEEFVEAIVQLQRYATTKVVNNNAQKGGVCVRRRKGQAVQS